MAILLLIFSEYQDQKTSWIRKIVYAGIVKRLVWKVLKPRDLKFKVRYAEGGFVGISSVRLTAYSGQRS